MKTRILTVREPFASLILRGEKTIELRTWSIPPGPLGIHAAKWRKQPGRLLCVVDVGESRDAVPGDAGEACCDIEPDDDFWAHPLSNVRPVRQEEISGRLGIWYYDVTYL